MIRVSITGLLTLVGTLLLVAGVTAAVPISSWEPVCRATETFKLPCQRAMVAAELASAVPSLDAGRLLDLCGEDQLCRLEVLNARPAGDAHAERALCEMWAPDFRLSCEQGIQARDLGGR